MNPDLERLQPYPFERLRKLLAGVRPPAGLSPINLSIGEPRHPTPAFILNALTQALPGVAQYPQTVGSLQLRQAIARWAQQRWGLDSLDPETQVLPVAGTREALFAFAQAVIDRSRDALVVAPNPFYQIYEGAALLAGAQPLYLPTTAANGFRMAWERISDADWSRVQLVYVCTPGNPTGRVMPLAEWRQLFELADRHNFVIASDECYSEIYFDEGKPPLGGLQAAAQLGRSDFRQLMVFSSLSKRSNVPGMRSGFVAGDASLIRPFLQYRTYHGCALPPPVQAASVAAWSDEEHVVDNRRLYTSKFERATPLIARQLACSQPDAAFYLWAKTPGDDAEYARQLFAATHVTVLPGSFLSRNDADGNPGRGFVRIALVASVEDVSDAAQRIASFSFNG